MFIKKIKIDIELVKISGVCCEDPRMLSTLIIRELKTPSGSEKEYAVFLVTKCLECNYENELELVDILDYGFIPKIFKLTDLTPVDLEAIYTSESIFVDD